MTLQVQSAEKTQNPQSISQPKNNSSNENPQESQPIQKQIGNKQPSTYEKFVDNILNYSKITSQISKQQVEKILQTMFGLTSSKKQQRQILAELKDKSKRDGLIILDLLLNQSQYVQTQAKYYFSMIIQQIASKILYINIKSLIRLINIYLNFNKPVYYVNQKFNWDYIINSCNITTKGMNSIRQEVFFKKMVNEIIQIINIIFKEYNRIFDRLNSIDPIKNQNLSFFTQKIWNNISNIINIQKLNKKNITHSIQLNILLKGLNICLLDFKSQYFSLNNICNQILPLFVENMKLLQISSQLDIELIQTFIIHSSFLYYNRKVQKFEGSIGSLIKDSNMKRFQCLTIFESKRNLLNLLSKLQPLRTLGFVLVLQKIIEYFLQNQSNSRDENEGHVFITQSICNIVKLDHNYFMQNKNSKFRNISRYIFNQIPQGQDQDINFFSQDFISNVIKYCKIMNVLCFPEAKIFIQAPQIRINNKNMSFIKVLIRIIQQISVKNNQQKQDLIFYLQEQGLIIAQIYQFFHRLIITDSSHYLQIRQYSEFKFRSYQDFLCEIIVNYLREYAQGSSNKKLCILAMNNLIYKQEKPIVQKVIKSLSKLNQSNIQILSQNNNQSLVSCIQLQYIIENLFKDKNNLVPICHQIILCCQYNQESLNKPWFKKISEYLMQIPQIYHPLDIYQYAQVLLVCLQQIIENSKIIPFLQSNFNFQFIKKYVNHVLMISFHEQNLKNILMECKQYQKIIIGIKLMEKMVKINKLYRQTNRIYLIPQSIKNFFEQSIILQGKQSLKTFLNDKNQNSLSYQSSLMILLLSNSFNQYKNPEAQYNKLIDSVYGLLINIYQLYPGKNQQSHVVSYSFYNPSTRKPQVRQFDLDKLLRNHIQFYPSYLAQQYLLCRGKDTIKPKNLYVESTIKFRNAVGNKISQTKLKSQLLLAEFTKQSNLNPQSSANNLNYWQHLFHQMQQIYKFIQQWLIKRQNEHNEYYQSQQIINLILLNIHQLTIFLFDQNKIVYAKFMAKFYPLFFNISLNKPYILANYVSLKLKQTYIKSLLIFLNCRGFLQDFSFSKLRNQEFQKKLYRFLMQIIEITYERTYNVENEGVIFDILQFGIAFLLEIMDENDKNYLLWLRQIIQKIQQRPRKDNQGSEILITLMIKSIIQGKIRTSPNQLQQKLQLNNNNEYLLLNIIRANDTKVGQKLLKNLLSISSNKHSIYFINSCNYILELSKLRDIKELQKVQHNDKFIHIVEVLAQVLEDNIKKERSYYILWIVQILIQLINNPYVDRKQMYLYFFEFIFKNKFINSRIADIINIIGSVYRDDLKNIWTLNQIKTESKIQRMNFSEKSQILAYLRLLNLFYFNYEENRCSQIHIDKNHEKMYKKLQQSIYNLISLLIELLKFNNQPEQTSQSWQINLKKIDLAFLCYEKKMGYIQQIDRSQLKTILRSRDANSILNQIMNIQLVSLVSLWLPIFTQRQRFTNLYLKKNSQKNIYNLLELLDQIKNKILFYNKNQKYLRSVFFNLNESIYNSSTISRQLHFTNTLKLSSALKIDIGSIVQTLQDGFLYVNTLINQIINHYAGSMYKFDRNIIQRYRQIASNPHLQKNSDVF